MTEKVWFAQRQYIISKLLTDPKGVEFARGEWSGFAKAQTSIMWVLPSVPSLIESTPRENLTFEQKLGLY